MAARLFDQLGHTTVCPHGHILCNVTCLLFSFTFKWVGPYHFGHLVAVSVARGFSSHNSKLNCLLVE